MHPAQPSGIDPIMKHATARAWWGVLLCAAACSNRGAPPAEGDGGPEAGRPDATLDAGALDAENDAPWDAAADAVLDTFDAGPLTGDEYFYVFDLLDIGAPEPEGDPTIVPGFDLDGVVSDGSEIETCRTADFTSPPPDSESGVDNALGPLLAREEPRFNIRANLRGSVRIGKLLVLLRLRGVDDLVDDDRVEVDVLFGLLPEGVAAPAFVGERFEPGQTFDVDARSLDAEMQPRVTLPGQIVGGRLRAGPGRLGLSIPFGADLVELQLDRVELRADVSATELSRGVIGGALDVEDTAVALEPISDFDIALIRLVLGGAADLDREGGACTSASIGLVFAGVEAIEGTVRMP